MIIYVYYQNILILPIPLRKAANRELVLGAERSRQVIEQALGKRVRLQKQDRPKRKGAGGIEGEQIGLEFQEEKSNDANRK